jgi:hypothetical protein
MPSLNWIGKDAVIRHHKELPFRLLEPDAGRSSYPRPPAVEGSGERQNNGNLIVQGDKLHALKALLPRYAARM